MIEDLFLESKIRRIINKPEEILRDLEIKKGDKVLDIGCGSGFLTIPLAFKVSFRGCVYGIDINDKRIEKLKEKIKSSNLKNIITLKADASNLKNIPDAFFDLALFFLSLHHIKEPFKALEEAYRKIKLGGKIFIYEPRRSRFFGHGTEVVEILNLLKNLKLKIKYIKVGKFTWKVLLEKYPPNPKDTS
ncbi:Demethylrebeccamycin-D-glucose O-methyltransferase [archaeon HR06]|nr:Demethylrebeccamycin-D-glucose O-methyltransferase [archaeon HR06]